MKSLSLTSTQYDLFFALGQPTTSPLCSYGNNKQQPMPENGNDSETLIRENGMT